MGTDVPVDRLVVGAASLADEAAFVALADLAKVIGDRPDVEYRLIGGIMVSLHAQRWRLGPRLYRQTADADLGVPPAVIVGTDILASLDELGYKKVAGNRFERPLDVGTSVAGNEAPQQVAAIDVLVPAYTSRAKDNVRVGDLNTTEVPGLALALNRPSVRVALEMVMLDGRTTLTAEVMLPDETSALVLRAYAWQVRGQGTDAVDLWRALEIASAAGLALDGQEVEDIARARMIIQQVFQSPGTAVDSLAKTLGLSREEQTTMRTRIRALAARVMGTPDEKNEQ
jgi:hypothetical protein